MVTLDVAYIKHQVLAKSSYDDRLQLKMISKIPIGYDVCVEMFAYLLQFTFIRYRFAQSVELEVGRQTTF